MPERVRKPEWLKISIGANERYTETKRIVESHCLHTICSSGRCPNMGECWGKGTATFMIGGNICTRCCKFCNTASGKPLPLDADEPTHVAESIALMKLSHAVVTSVDRDDLPDLGASHWVRTIREIKRLNPDTTVEVLIPDFQGRKELVAQVIDAQPEIISHNMETVRRIRVGEASFLDHTPIVGLKRSRFDDRQECGSGRRLPLLSPSCFAHHTPHPEEGTAISFANGVRLNPWHR